MLKPSEFSDTWLVGCYNCSLWKSWFSSWRNSVFGKLGSWPIELVVERSLASSTMPLSPSNALLRVFEVTKTHSQERLSFLLDAMDSSYQAISSGLLQEDGPGIKDPCEREQVRNADLLSFILRFGVCCTTLFGFCFLFDNWADWQFGSNPIQWLAIPWPAAPWNYCQYWPFGLNQLIRQLGPNSNKSTHTKS